MTYRKLYKELMSMTDRQLDQEVVAEIYSPMTEDTFCGMVKRLGEYDGDDERFEDGQIYLSATTEGL